MDRAGGGLRGLVAAGLGVYRRGAVRLGLDRVPNRGGLYWRRYPFGALGGRAYHSRCRDDDPYGNPEEGRPGCSLLWVRSAIDQHDLPRLLCEFYDTLV